MKNIEEGTWLTTYVPFPYFQRRMPLMTSPFATTNKGALEPYKVNLNTYDYDSEENNLKVNTIEELSRRTHNSAVFGLNMHWLETHNRETLSIFTGNGEGAVNGKMTRIAESRTRPNTSVYAGFVKMSDIQVIETQNNEQKYLEDTFSDVMSTYMRSRDYNTLENQNWGNEFDLDCLTHALVLVVADTTNQNKPRVIELLKLDDKVFLSSLRFLPLFYNLTQGSISNSDLGNFPFSFTYEPNSPRPENIGDSGDKVINLAYKYGGQYQKMFVHPNEEDAVYTPGDFSMTQWID